MANSFMNQMKNENNYKLTENGAVAHSTTTSAVLDMFAFGGAYRNRSDEDVILLFKNAFEEDPLLAMKCLFYLRDVRGGQGERRFFRVAYKWLCEENPKLALLNLEQIPEFGRWDDIIYIAEGTKILRPATTFLRYQLQLDRMSKTPSLCAKWMPSQNASNEKTRELGRELAFAFGMTNKEYRQMLSSLREKIKVLETLMSENRWDEIEFDKIPSRAGLIYKNAFAQKEVTAARYAAFIEDKNTKINAGVLYPYEIVAKATKISHYSSYYGMKTTNLLERETLEKMWNALPNYFADKPEDKMLCVVDTSGSMTGAEASAPINVAISLGLYAAERARGPFAGHYISFSRTPQLIETKGVDFCDKVQRIYKTNLCENTNIEAAFEMVLKTAIRNGCTQDDLPKSIIVISDMEFDYQRGYYGKSTNTLMENIAERWRQHGYEMPNLVYWNVQARQNNIPMTVKDGVSLVSGFSPVLFEQIMKGKTAYDLMLDKLNSERYACIK